MAGTGTQARPRLYVSQKMKGVSYQGLVVSMKPS